MKIFLHFFCRIKAWGYHRYPRIYSILHRHKSLVKFVMSGGIAGGVDLGVLYICHGLLNINVIVSTSIAYILSFWVSFYLQKFWTFNNQDQHRVWSQICIYIVIAFINLNLNGYLMHIFVNRWQVHYLWSQLIVSILIGLESFVAYKFIVFRKKDKAEVNPGL